MIDMLTECIIISLRQMLRYYSDQNITLSEFKSHIYLKLQFIYDNVDKMEDPKIKASALELIIDYEVFLNYK
jgi:hypothetical protein